MGFNFCQTAFGRKEQEHYPMSELLSYILFPLARLIYESAPSKLRTALANGGKTLTALEVAHRLLCHLPQVPAGRRFS